jgi:phosphoserine phosphatase
MDSKEALSLDANPTTGMVPRPGQSMLVLPRKRAVVAFVCLFAFGAFFGALVTSIIDHAGGSSGDQFANFVTASDDVSPSIARTKQMLRNADAVFFDVDSTVVQTEGIELIGKCFNVQKEIEDLTTKAMGGDVTFQQALTDRLALLAKHGMTKESLERCVRVEAVPKFTPGVQEVVKRLHYQGKDVYLVSGGFKNMIAPVAFELHIPSNKIYANEILFDKEGKYAGFDKANPTSQSGGKARVLKQMKRRHGYRTMIMFGDGATDMEARTQGPASAFIGYGGVTARPKIKAGADWFVYSFQEILSVLAENEKSS